MVALYTSLMLSKACDAYCLACLFLSKLIELAMRRFGLSLGLALLASCHSLCSSASPVPLSVVTAAFDCFTFLAESHDILVVPILSQSSHVGSVVYGGIRSWCVH